MKQLACLCLIVGGLLLLFVESFANVGGSVVYAAENLGDGLQPPEYGGQSVTRPAPKSENYFWLNGISRG